MRTACRSGAVLLAAALVGIVTPAVGRAESPATTKLTLIHVNDTHSRVDSWGPKDFHLDGTLGGLTRAATVIQQLQADNENTVLVHAGDLHHGDLYFNAFLGVPEYLVLEMLGLQAYAIGNHELDLTPAMLLASLGAAAEAAATLELPGVPAISANLDLTGYPPLQDFIQPRRVVQVGDVKVGFFGLTLPDPGEQLADASGSVAISDAYEKVADAQAYLLRGEGADVIVCLAHIGMESARALAAANHDLDVVVQGHDHEPLATAEQFPGSKTVLVSAGAYYRYVGSLDLLVTPGAAPPVAVGAYHLWPVDAGVPRSEAVLAFLAQFPPGVGAEPAMEALFGEFEKPIAFALRPIAAESEEGSPNRTTPIGNLVTDIYRERGRTQIALEVAGFAEDPLPWGPVNGADVFRVQSYGFDPATQLGFKLVTTSLTGEQLAQLLAFGLTTPGGLFPQVSGMSFVFNSQATSPGELLEKILVRGRPIEPGRSYTVTTHEGIVLGLAQYGIELPFEVLTERGGRNARPVFVYTALRDGIAKRGWLLPDEEPRICDAAMGPCP